MPGFLGKDPIWLMLFQMGWDEPRRHACSNIFPQGSWFVNCARYQRRRIQTTRPGPLNINKSMMARIIWDLHYMAILSNAKSLWISLNDHLISDSWFISTWGIVHHSEGSSFGESNKFPTSGDRSEPPKSLEVHCNKGCYLWCRGLQKGWWKEWVLQPKKDCFFWGGFISFHRLGI